MADEDLTACHAAASTLMGHVLSANLPADDFFDGLGPMHRARRRTYALDLSALLDYSNYSDRETYYQAPNGFACLRPAVMIDYAPDLDAFDACRILDRLSSNERTFPSHSMKYLEVFVVHDVVLIANVPRLLEVLSSKENDVRSKLIDVLPNAVPPLRHDRVLDALTHASHQIKAKLNVHRDRDYWKEPRVPFDLVAALGPGAAFVPLPTLVGVCLGYPRVYAWSPADDVAAAAQSLSTTPLVLYEVRATWSAIYSEKDIRKTKHRVCGFTAPFEKDEHDSNDPEISTRERDITKWFGQMRERAFEGGDIWRDMELVVTTRDAGPVAL
tara:strand:- start:837 stop:1820 length:984 start_codon:yes stop_codon:yes gene_type:complete